MIRYSISLLIYDGANEQQVIDNGTEFTYLYTDSECETIIEVPNSNGPDSLYEELSLTEFDIRGVSHTTRIENFMRLIGYKSTYRPFLGNTYYEFVQGETKDERLDVMLMYTVSPLIDNNLAKVLNCRLLGFDGK